MRLLLLVALLAATPEPPSAPAGAIEATIRGTTQPLEVELLVRDEREAWQEVAHQSLPAETRRVRFDGLPSGVYQIRVSGAQPAERLGTKVALGRGDTRSTTITVEPFVVRGQVTLGGTELGAGALVLRHRDLQLRAPIALAPDGTFRATLWQRGAFTFGVRAPALPTEYADEVELDGTSAAAWTIDIPDGRITGIVRDAKSGAPVADAIVALQTKLDEREEHVQLTTRADGKFDFAGIKHGQHIVRVQPPQHLEPEPIAFALTEAQRLRELDVRVDAGRSIAIVVIDRENDPVAKARVFAVTDGRPRARTVTDEDGRASVAVPEGEPATLIVVPEEGPFGMLRVGREETKGRLQLYLPRSTSSLLIRAQTTTGADMPPISLLMRYNGELVPPEVADELAAVQGLRLATGENSEANLQNIPSGSYEFWPYRTDNEAQSIVASASALLAPIQVNVRTGENKIAVKFAEKGARPPRSSREER